MLYPYKHHHTETIFIFVIFESISISRSIYVIYSHESRKTFFFCLFLEYFSLFLVDNVNKKWKSFLNSKHSAARWCVAFAWFFANFSLALLIKILLIKSCSPVQNSNKNKNQKEVNKTGIISNVSKLVFTNGLIFFLFRLLFSLRNYHFYWNSLSVLKLYLSFHLDSQHFYPYFPLFCSIYIYIHIYQSIYLSTYLSIYLR